MGRRWGERVGRGGGACVLEDVRSWDDLVALRLLETGSNQALQIFFFLQPLGTSPFLGVNGWILPSIYIPFLLQILKGILGLTSRQGESNMRFCFQRAYFFVKSSFYGCKADLKCFPTF